MEGFQDIVVRPGVQAFEAALKRFAGGDDQHRKTSLGHRHGADVLEHVDAVHPGKPQVQKHGVDVVHAQSRQALGTGRRVGDDVRFAFQSGTHGPRDEGIVFNEKNVHA